MHGSNRRSDVFSAFNGPLFVTELLLLLLLLLLFLFHFGCWRQLILTRQATGHLNWPLCNKEISRLLSAVPGPFELTFMQQQGDGCTGCANAVPDNAAACRAVLANTFRDGPGAHGKGCDMVMQIKAWAGMANGVKEKAGKAWHGKCRPGKVQCNRSAHEAGRPRCGLVRWWRECGGVGQSEDGLDLPYGLPPTYHLCLYLSIPTPISL